METANFSSNIAGIKTLWVIRFDGTYPSPYGEEKSKPHFDLLYPSPLNKDRWIVVNPEKNKKDVETLTKFQKLCEDAKDRCDYQLNVNTDLFDKSNSASEEIENLSQLLLYFNEIMRHIQKREEIDDSEMDDL